MEDRPQCPVVTRYRRVIEAVSEAALLLDPGLCVRATNAAAAAAFDLEGNEVAGRDMLSLVPPGQVPLLADAIVRSRGAAPALIALDVVLDFGKGRATRTELRVAPLLDSDGVLEAYLVTAPGSARTGDDTPMLRVVADGATGPSGPDLLESLAQHAGRSLGVRYALIGRLQGTPPTSVTTLAVSVDGRLTPNITYDLAGTPCEQVVGRQACHYPADVQRLFPQDHLLQSMGVESYLGAALVDSQNRPIGVMALLHDKPLHRSDDVFSILNLFAARAGAELERAHMEERLQATEDRWREMAEHTNEGLFDLALDTGRVYLSPRCARLLGYDDQRAAPPATVGSLFELLHPESAPRARAEFRRSVARGTEFRLTLRVRNRDGEYRWFEARATISGDAAGRPVRVLGLLSDITDQRQHDIMLRHLSEVAKVWGWSYDIEREAFTFMADTLRSVELTEEITALVRHPDILLSENDAARARAAVQAATTVGTPWDFVYRRADALGTISWRRTIARVEVTRGVPSRIYGAVQDVTASQQVEQQLLQAQKMETVGLLASGVVHDFNNLITAVGGLGELVARTLPEDHDAQADLVELSRTVHSTRRLTRQLLSLGRRPAGSPVPVSVNAVIGDTCTLLRRVMPASVEIDWRPDHGVTPVVADRTHLEQVLMNLAVNARDAMPRGGELSFATSRVTHAAPRAAAGGVCPPGSYVQITVTDSGSGMSEETQRRIFEPFYTTKARHGGSGLGLATCMTLVQQMGGWMTVDSRLGYGTTFTVWLPPAIASETALVDSPRPAPDPKTILVVEDEPMVRLLTVRSLEQRGYRVLEAEDGATAIRLAESQPVDLLLADIGLPDMSGTTLWIALAAVRPGLPVLFASGDSPDAVAQAGVGPVRPAFLQKPFAPDRLVETVGEVLRAARAA